ncbi:hypothetical protein Q7M_1560, partial (plasmid) [Borrelia crocidurae str. Achema]
RGKREKKDINGDDDGGDGDGL